MKKIALIILLILMIYTFNNTNVYPDDPENSNFINDQIWIPMQQYTQHINLGFLAIGLITFLVILFKKEKKPKKEEDVLDFLR